MSTNDDMKSRWMKSWRSVSLLPLLVAFLLLIGISGVASAAEMVTNGTFIGSTGWTLATVTYDGTNTATADGSGSLTLNASGRNTANTGSATLPVSIGAGSQILSAADVVAFSKQQWTGASGTPNTVTISLKYADTSTVQIYTASIPLAGAWNAETNATATGFPLTLSQNVTDIIIDFATKCGNNAAATADVFVDNVSITYTSPSPSNSYGTMTSMSGPLTADLSQQTVATVPVTLNNGGATVSSYTVNLSGTVTAGDVAGVYVTDGTNTWSATGSYGNGSSVVCSGANAIPGATLSINVTLNSTADTKTVAVTLQTDANAASTLPKGPSTALTISAPAGPSNTYGTMTSMSGPLTANLTQQTVATVPVTLNLGGASVSSYTVNLSGTVTAGDVAGVYVTDGTSTWSATGSYGNGSSVVCSGANAIPGATLSIKVSLNATADAKTVAVTLQTDANAASSLPKGPSTALAISAPAGPVSTINSCSGCHGYPSPLVDSGTRDPATGTFVGDHAKHNYDCSTCHGTLPGAYGHRDGNINISSGTIGLNNGTYTKGATVAQSNAPSPGSCDSVNCHGNNNTGTWGGAGYASCATSTCHGFPPNTNAHSKHYTSKGWSTGTYTNCVACHPDDFTAHADRTDGVVELANLTPSGAGATITCASISNTGCHNTKSTPQWGSTGITCSSCHVIGGGAAGDPTTGLHVTTNLLAHDNQFKATPGEVLPGTATCISCHSATTTLTSSLHFNGTVENSAFATYTWNLTNIPVTGYVRASDACAATCHTDSGTWNRRWSGAKTYDVAWSYTDNAVTAGVCGNCHGSFATGWNIVGATDHVNPSAVNDNNPGTADNPDTLATSKTNHGECSKCHGWGVTAYSTGTKHVNNLLEMNSALDTTPGDGDCTTVCHNGQALTMNAASGWTDATVVGDGVACGDCHNGGVTPSSTSGAHGSHGAGIAQLVAGGAACVPCHGNNGGAGFESSLAGSHGIGNAVNWATNLVYSQAATRGNIDGTCTGTAGCHVATTNIAWSNLNPTNCNQCHYSTTDTANWGWTGTAGNISMISSTEYTTVGHGQATINTVAANKACMDCHDIAVTHDKTATLTGANPFRLKASFTCNSIVAGCHSITGLLGTHDQATAGAKYTWPFAAKCVDCHDPHGDGSNLAMIHSDLADKGSAANWVRNAPDAAIETMVFTNTTGILADSYAEPSTTFDGICQECHTLTTSMKDNLVANGANHTATTGCMSCHAHGEGFKAAGCNGCHGGDNVAWSNKNFWPSAGASYPKRPGTHEIHINKLMAKLGTNIAAVIANDTLQKSLCDYCHDDAAGAGGSGHDGTAAPAEVGSFNRIFDAAVDSGTAGSYTPGNGTNGVCSNVDCHNNNPTATTPTNYDWYDGATSACVMCHVPGGTGTVDPLSGLHKAGTLTSSTPHDDAFAASATCTTCHSTMSAFMSGTHGDAINNGNTVSSLGLVVGLYTQTSTVGNGSGTCSGGTAGAAGCHDSIFDAGSWARKWDDTISYQTGGNQCAGCHGGFNNDWTFGSAANTTDLSVSHTYDWNNDTVSNELVGKHLNNTGNTTKCNICHVYADSPYSLTWGTGTHGNDKIAMNTMGGANTYSATTWTCTNTCHTEGGSHAMEASASSGTRVENIAGPALTCASCHSGYTTHIDADGAAGVYTSGTCTDCHLAHADGTTGVNDIEISTVYTGTTAVPTMTTADGTTALYSSHGYKIRLGGNATIGYAKSTEAEWCWACHDDQATKITEWQANNNTSTGAIAYNYGQLYTTITGTTETSNWIGAFWRSAKGLTASDPYYYKRGAIRSTHSANYDGTTATSDATKPWKGSLINTVAGYSTTYNKGENLDAVANIRCSYCHDVHGTHDGIKGDLNPTGGTPSGQPYLRGTWLGNPYQEDGAPRFGMASFTNQGPTIFGIVPRASASPTNNGSATAGLNVGGWWIDQNSGNPVENHLTTSFRTATGFAGLCEQCHGSDKNGTWLNTEINAIDQITGEALWVSGGNGHANSVMGASGATAAANNIFSRAKRGALTRVNGQTAKVNVDMGLATETTSGYSYRNGTSYNWNPSVLQTDTTTKSTGKPYAFRYFAWNTTLQTTAQDSSFATGSIELTMNTGLADDTNDPAQANYHTFSCSKCHNPHASRLPKLMITNCLDTNHNSWDDNSTFTGTALTGNYAGLRHSQWASAQNCHRLDARATASGGATTVGVGWNKATPWIEDTTPNTTITAEPTTLLTY